jgi:hypothetical protein
VSFVKAVASEVLTVGKEHEWEGGFTVAEHEATSVVLQLSSGILLSFSLSRHRLPTYHLIRLLVLNEPPILGFAHRPAVEDITIPDDRGIVTKLS